MRGILLQKSANAGFMDASKLCSFCFRTCRITQIHFSTLQKKLHLSLLRKIWNTKEYLVFLQSWTEETCKLKNLLIISKCVKVLTSNLREKHKKNLKMKWKLVKTEFWFPLTYSSNQSRCGPSLRRLHLRLFKYSKMHFCRIGLFKWMKPFGPLISAEGIIRSRFSSES